MKYNKPSGTAQLIASSIPLIHHDPHLNYLVSTKAAEISKEFMRHFSFPWKHIIPLVEKGWFRRCAYFLECRTLPGHLTYPPIERGNSYDNRTTT